MQDALTMDDSSYSAAENKLVEFALVWIKENHLKEEGNEL